MSECLLPRPPVMYAFLLTLVLASMTLVWGASGLDARDAGPGALLVQRGSEEAAPELAWFAHLGGSLNGHVELVEGDTRHLFVAAGPRILVFDVSNPERPSRVGESAELPGPPTHMSARGTNLYAVTARYGLFVFDVADPASPRAVGRLPGVGASAFTLEAVGDQLLLPDKVAGIEVVDVGDPESPRLLDTVTYKSVGQRGELLELDALDVRDSDMALVAEDPFPRDRMVTRVLLVVDASNPTRLAEVGRIPFEVSHPISVVWWGQHVYVGGGNGIHVFDVSDRRSPRLVGTMPGPEDSIRMWHLYGSDSRLYLTGQRSAPSTSVLVEYSLSNPAEPMPVATYDNGPWGMLSFSGGRIYSRSDNVAILGVYDIVPGRAPAPRSVIQLPGSIGDAAVDDGLLYVLSSGGLMTFALDEPHRRLGRWYMPWRGRRIAHDGRYLYVAVGNQGVRVLDMTDPSSPRELDPLQPHRAKTYSVDNFIVDGSRGFALVRVSRSPTELWVVDLDAVAGPTSREVIGQASGPELLGIVQLDIGWNRMPALGATGSTVLLGSDHGSDAREIVAVDVTDPTAPREAARQPIPEHVWWLEPGDGASVYAGTDNAVLVLDAADPSDVVERGRLSTADAEGGRAVHGLAHHGDSLFALAAHPPAPGDETRGATLLPLEILPPWGIQERKAPSGPSTGPGLEIPAWFRSGYALRVAVDGQFVVANGGAQGATIARWHDDMPPPTETAPPPDTPTPTPGIPISTPTAETPGPTDTASTPGFNGTVHLPLALSHTGARHLTLSEDSRP